jgi:hypothetical protein
MTSNTLLLVKIEIKRVQTYLFSSERLKSMVGANTLLGEIMRGRRPEQATDFAQMTDTEAVDAAGLFGLAARHGACAPPTADLQPPAAKKDDPLQADDDPSQNWQAGVMVRDGGRVHALFDTEQKARAFIAAARLQVTERLPGIRLVARLSTIESCNEIWEEKEQPLEQAALAGAALLTAALFEPCNEMPMFPAVTLGGQDGTERQSAATHAKHQAELRFRQKKSFDVIGLLEQAEKLPLGSGKALPHDFDVIAGESGYLAVVHLDGNDIGQRSRGVREQGQADRDFFAVAARSEAFFHQMRVTTRQAVCAALGATFKDRAQCYRLLMLGGDDVLLACEARYAFEFLTHYGNAIRQAGDLPDRGGPLTVGAGIAIGHHSHPFHCLHELAESLASEAKAFRRSHKDTPITPWGGSSHDTAKDAACTWGQASVVSWIVTSESHVPDLSFAKPDVIHKVLLPDHEHERNEALFLRQRPWPFGLPSGHNGDDQDAHRGIGWLWAQAEQLVGLISSEGNELARSQLKTLAQRLGEGRRSTEHRLARAPKGLRESLKKSFGSQVWRERADQSGWETPVRDLVTLVDLAGGFKKRQGKEGRRRA